MKNVFSKFLTVLLCFNLLVNSFLPLVVYAQDFDPGDGGGSYDEGAADADTSTPEDTSESVSETTGLTPAPTAEETPAPTQPPSFTPPAGLDPSLYNPPAPAQPPETTPAPTAASDEIITTPTAQERALDRYARRAEAMDKYEDEVFTNIRADQQGIGANAVYLPSKITGMIQNQIDRVDEEINKIAESITPKTREEVLRDRRLEQKEERLNKLTEQADKEYEQAEKQRKEAITAAMALRPEQRIAALNAAVGLPQDTPPDRTLAVFNTAAKSLGVKVDVQTDGAFTVTYDNSNSPLTYTPYIPGSTFNSGTILSSQTSDTKAIGELKDYCINDKSAFATEMCHKITDGVVVGALVTGGVVVAVVTAPFWIPEAAIITSAASSGGVTGLYAYATTTGSVILSSTPGIVQAGIGYLVPPLSLVIPAKVYIDCTKEGNLSDCVSRNLGMADLPMIMTEGREAAAGAKVVRKATRGADVAAQRAIDLATGGEGRIAGTATTRTTNKVGSLENVDDVLDARRPIWGAPEEVEAECAGVCSIVASAWNKITGKGGGQAEITTGEQFIARSPDDLITQKQLDHYGLTPDSIVYRVVEKKYVKNGMIEGNPRSMASIDDPYHPVDMAEYFGFPREQVEKDLGVTSLPKTYPKPMDAKDLEVPSLNVAVKDPSQYAEGKPGFVKVGIRVGDILAQGGKIYTDTGAAAANIRPLIVTVPKGQVKVVSVVDPKAPIEPSSVVSQPQRLSGGQWVDAKTVDNQIPSTLNIGSEVSVQRSSGKVEPGWIIKSVDPDTDEVTVANYTLGKYKKVPRSQLEELNNASIVIPKKASFNEKLIPMFLKTIAKLVFPREAFAQEQATVSAVLKTIPDNFDQVMNIDEYQLLSTKTDVKNMLLEKGQITSEEVKQLLIENSQIPAQGLRNKNRIVVTTGDDGQVEFEADPGTYKIDSLPIKDVDLFLPATITVSSSDQIIGVGIKKGSGQIKTNGQVISSSQGQKTAKVKIVTFYDKNSNGVFDSDEKVIPWAGVVVSLTKAVQDKSISLKAGWNLVSLTSLPEKALTASALLSEISKQGGEATTVSTLVDGAWKSYVRRGENDYSMDDFPIEPGKAYFVKALQPSTFKYSGQNLVAPVKLKLNSGWNAVGLPKTSKEYKASTLIDDIVKEGSASGTVAWWDSGLWDTFVKKKGEDYGNNFTILPNFGYIIKVQKEGEVVP